MVQIVYKLTFSTFIIETNAEEQYNRAKYLSDFSKEAFFHHSHQGPKSFVAFFHAD